MRPVVLAIGGLDPSGGAGLAADVRAVRTGGAFAAPVCAALTVQSTRGLERVVPVAARLLRAQAEEVLRTERVLAVKVGALGSRENVRAVRALLDEHDLPLVLDPVRMPTRGRAALASPQTFDALIEELFPRVTLLTPNAEEAAAILDERLGGGDAAVAARRLAAMGPRAVLLKGGHFATGTSVVDVLAIRDEARALRRRRRLLPKLHGGGCYLASLVASRLALRLSGKTNRRPSDDDVFVAVREARALHLKAILRADRTGGPLAVLD